MAFGRWFSLEAAAACAPTAPGVYQVRLAHGLVDYPTGRSAMIHYGAAADVREAVAALALAHAGRDWLCRFSDPDAPERGEPEVLLAGLMAAFRRRFGASPGFPE